MFGACIEGLFQKARQMVGKLIEKLYGYSKKQVKYCTHFSYFRSAGQKSASNGQFSVSEKHSACRKNIRARQIFNSAAKMSWL
jgi:hypothetical protein